MQGVRLTDDWLYVTADKALYWVDNSSEERKFILAANTQDESNIEYLMSVPLGIRLILNNVLNQIGSRFDGGEDNKLT